MHDLDAQRHFEAEWRTRVGRQGFLHCLCRRTHAPPDNSTQKGARQSSAAPNWVLVPAGGIQTEARGLVPRGGHWLRLFAREYDCTLQLFEASHPVATRRAANLHSYMDPPRPLFTVFLAEHAYMHHKPTHG